MPEKGVYMYKVDLKALTAAPYGDMAEKLSECSGEDMYSLEKAMVAACTEVSGFPTFQFENSVVTPKMGLFTACIGTAKIGGGGGGGAKAPEPEPEPEEEEEDMGFDLFD